jgi:hypothetical protein
MAGLMLLAGASATSWPAHATPSCGEAANADDTACLQGLINAGGSVTLAASRTYHLTRPLQIGANTTLNGGGATVSSTVPKGGAILVQGAGVTIHDLKIEAPTAAPAGGRFAIVVLPQTTGLQLYNNRISGYFNTAIMIAGGYQGDIRITKNAIDPDGGRIGYGVLVNAVNLGENPSAYPHDIEIAGNTITNVHSDAVEINSPIGKRVGYPATANRITIKNNTLSAPNSEQGSAGFCVGIAGGYQVQISGNQMSDCKWQGIHIEDKSSQVEISHNVIRRTIGPLGSQTAWKRYSSGIFCLNSNNIRILGNTISDAKNNGIEMGYNPQGMNSNIVISGNKIANSGDAGIVFSGSPKANVKSMVGEADGYPDNTISNSGSADIAACVSLGGRQSASARCGRKQQ